MKTVVLVILGVWLAQRWGLAQSTQKSLEQIEQLPADPYSGVTSLWQQLDGTHITQSGKNPNAHPAHFSLSFGLDAPQVQNPCVCR